MTQPAVAADLLETARRIGVEVAGPAADAVDREGRFPHEAVAALREARLLGAFVPQELGGRGMAIGELAAVAETLGRCCASTAMVYAMHQIEVACLVRHGLSEEAGTLVILGRALCRSGLDPRGGLREGGL